MQYVQNVLNETEQVVFERFIDLGGRSAQQIGFSRSLGQIYAALYLSDRPTSLSELTQLLHISKGSASMGVRQLIAWGAVRSVWVRGDRRDYYEVNPNFAEVIKHILGVLVRPRVESAGNQLTDLQNLLNQSNPNEDPVSQGMKQRIAKLEGLRKKAAKVLPLIETLLR